MKVNEYKMMIKKKNRYTEEKEYGKRSLRRVNSSARKM